MFVTYREDFVMNTGNENTILVDEESSFTRFSMLSPLVFESVNNKDYFSLLIDSNSFGTVNCDAHIKTKTEYSINHVFKSKTFPELNTLHHICEPE